MGLIHWLLSSKPLDEQYPELQGIRRRFTNCSPSEIAALIANNPDFRPVFEKGVLPVPLEAAITLQSVAPTKIVIYAGSRNMKFWTYTLDFVQDKNDTILTASVDYNVESQGHDLFPRWSLDMRHFNHAIKMLEV